jgi:hypothetical protein
MQTMQRFLGGVSNVMLYFSRYLAASTTNYFFSDGASLDFY